MRKITIDQEVLENVAETLEGMAKSNWRNWGELASPEEFERWLKSRANLMGLVLREALAQPQQTVSTDRIVECAKRLVDHSDSRLGGCLSADSKASEIPSNAVSHVKARHLAALRAAISKSTGETK
jgi:hypothetical protein